jgi:endonuclease/exonuclease/phosphatase family metal-dependent hydrolase
MPYCASFRAGRFDFVVVCVHIAEGSSHGATGLALREREIDELVALLKNRSEQEIGKSFDRDIFIVGDFNIQSAGDRFFQALTRAPEPRFHMPPGMDNLGTNFDRTRTYDKIAWLPRPDFNFSGNFGVVPFGDVLYREPDQPAGAARKEISDHLPLWAEFRINELTQEFNPIINPP